jgi:hypothetical protein
VIHSAKKLKPKELQDLDAALEDMSYTCGSSFNDYVEGDQTDNILKKVFVREDLQCRSPIEVPYYACGSFALICSYCATGDDLVSGEAAVGIYSMCSECFKSKPKLLKRKRKIFDKSSAD